MKITVVTLYTSNFLTNEFIKTKLPNFRQYTTKHNYETVKIEKSLDKSRSPQWSKIKAVYNTLERTNTDWVFWCDADTLFMDFERRLETFIDEDYNLIYCSDLSKTLWVNSGVFFAKNCDWTKEFLLKIYNDNNYYVQKRREFDYEQGSLRELLYEDRREEFIKVVESPDSEKRFQHFWHINDPLPIFKKSNQYFSEEKIRRELTYSPGDFIVHFAGCHNKGYLYSRFEELRENYL